MRAVGFAALGVRWLWRLGTRAHALLFVNGRRAQDLQAQWADVQLRLDIMHALVASANTPPG